MITKTAPSLHCLDGIRDEIREKNRDDTGQKIPVRIPWQSALAEAIRDPQQLLRLLDLPVSLLEQIEPPQHFPLRVTHSFIQRMRPGDLNDPLLKQILPLATEQGQSDWGSLDPVGDHTAMKSPGLLHKYQGRALLVSTAACAIHCRYCFRQHFPYQQANPLGNQWPATLEWLRANKDIHEVILSGGDPLSVSDERLARIVAQLDSVPHLRTLRIHTRLPVVLPQRIDSELLNWVTKTRLQVVFVLHINHPNELNQELCAALRQLQLPGVTLLNQSVLLSSINDDASVLIKLSQKLFETGVLPYYLHQLDQVKGAARFEVPVESGSALIAAMRSRLPGYLVPRYVKEIPGEDAKSPIFG